MQIALAVIVLAVLGSVAWITMNGPAKVVADVGMALLAHAYAIRRYGMERRDVLLMLKERHGDRFEVKQPTPCKKLKATCAETNLQQVEDSLNELHIHQFEEIPPECKSFFILGPTPTLEQYQQKIKEEQNARVSL